MIKKSVFLLLIVLVGCNSTKIHRESSKHLFTINFMGQLFVKKAVSLEINDVEIINEELFGEIPYPQTRGIHEFSIGYLDGTINYMKRYKIIESKPFEINDLNNIRITLEVDGKIENFIINTKEGKHYYIKYDLENEIELTQLDW